MTRLTIAQRIVMGFYIAPIALIAVALYALYDLRILRDQAEVVAQRDWPKIAPIMAIATGVRDNASHIRELLIDRNDPLAQTSIDNTRQRIDKALATLGPLLDRRPDGKAAFAALKKHGEVYQAAFSQMHGLILRNVPHEAVLQLEQSVTPAEQAMYQSLEGLMAMQDRLFDERERGAQTRYQDAQLHLLMMVLACLALVATVAVLVTRSVTRPLGGEPGDAARMLGHIAQGDLTIEVPVGAGSGDSMMSNMQEMQQSLHSMVRQIATSVDRVASSSEELSAVSSQTSSSLQLQGIEIEQAAAAVNQMTAAVDDVARNAMSTSEASRISEQTALDGREQVQETVASISVLADGVSEAAERIQQLAGRVQDISSVLDVIRSIAEQTNLLALNAAIEAARAGDAGRGFAVVADEVRALAHRTQESTREIEEMIGTIRRESGDAVTAMQSSSELVQATLQVARRSGEALDAIACSISQINERNLMIASATEQQALVAREVDRNLVSIRNLSEQVLQGAQHTDTAGQDLAHMAESLHQTVARFKV
jgi:methyl-accepting chemotaxis protein